MRTAKVYKKDIWGHVLTNWKALIRSWSMWGLLLGSIIISSFIYTVYDMENHEVKNIVITEIIAVVLNLLIIGSFYKLNTFKSYLYFLFVFKFVHICVTLVAFDTYHFGDVHHVASITNNVVTIISLMAIMMLVGFAFANVIITPLVIVLFGFNLVESRIIVKIKNPKKQIAFYIIWTFGWIIALMMILSKIQFIEEDALYKVFVKMLKEAGVKSSGLEMFASALYFLMSKGLFIIWFTILLKVNSFRGTDMFIRNAWSLGMASSLLFIGYQIQFLVEHVQKNDVLALPIFMMIVTILFLFRSLFYFGRTVRWNWHKLKTQPDKYIPYVFDKNKKLNLIVQAYYYHQEKKITTQEIKIKK